MKPVLVKYTETDVSDMKGNQFICTPKTFDDFHFTSKTGDYDNIDHDIYLNKPASTSIANLMATTKEIRDHDSDSFYSFFKERCLPNFKRTSKVHSSFSSNDINPHFKLKHNCITEQYLKSNMSSPVLSHVKHGKFPIIPNSKNPLSLKQMYSRQVSQSYNDLHEKESFKCNSSGGFLTKNLNSQSFRHSPQVLGNSRTSQYDNVTTDQLTLNFDASGQKFKIVGDFESIKILSWKMFQLDGFSKEDVAIQINKQTEYSKKLGKEYLNCFDFKSFDIVQSLRTFLEKVTLSGETQERERILLHFSKRYFHCNPNIFKSEDSCHSTTCAIVLLNTDLYGQNIGKKMSQQSFIHNLRGLNDGEDFDPSILRAIYQSIAKTPLPFEIPSSKQCNQKNLRRGESNKDLVVKNLHWISDYPYMQITCKPFRGMVFKRGYVMKKACLNTDGRKVPIGKRSWKMFYATLCETTLFLHKDPNGFTKEISDNLDDLNLDSMRILHSLALWPKDYQKKSFVFELKLPNWAVYLFRTSNQVECQQWIEAINLAASCFSAPALPGAVGSQMSFSRPLLPSAPTKLNLMEQIQEHEKNKDKFDQELNHHNSSNVIDRKPEEDKYLRFELARYQAYVDVLRKNYDKLRGTDRFLRSEPSERLKHLAESIDSHRKGTSSYLYPVSSSPAIIFETRV